MTVSKLFLYWIYTILIGSLIAPVFLGIGIGLGSGFNLELILLFLFFSFVTSIPAVLVFLLVLLYQTKRKATVKEKEWTLILTQLISAVVTFIIIGIAIGGNQLTPVVITTFLVYTAVGISLWSFEFSNNRAIQKRNTTNSPNKVETSMVDDSF